MTRGDVERHPVNPAHPRRPARVAARRGFTLFEVMAAVLVMGLIFTVLAQVNIEGVMAEGTSRRRLEASLLADEVLGDLEGELLAGGFPEEGSREEERGDFRVRVDVRPFDPSPYLALREEPETPGAGRREPEAVASLLDPPAAGQPSLIRRFDVSVAWSETGGLGDDEQVVRRTTFAYDAAAIAPSVEAASSGGDGSAAGGAAGGEAGRSTGGSNPPPADCPEGMDPIECMRRMLVR